VELTAAMLAAAASAVLLVVGGRDAAPRVSLPVRLPGPGIRLRDSVLKVAMRIGSSLGMHRVSAPATLAERIAAAGNPGDLQLREWTALKCAAAVAALIVALMTAGSFPGRLGIALLVAAPAAGFVLPDYWLARVAARRARAALHELPGMLDLLRVTVEAGRSPIAAMGLVGERFDGPLAAEWRAAAMQVALGVPQAQALGDMPRALPVPGVRAFVETLTYAHRAGSSLAGALDAQAATARHLRRQQIREQAARAGPQMQLVVALVLVPSVRLVIGAVLASELTTAGLGLDY
jgi:tight adherence protein C